MTINLTELRDEPLGKHPSQAAIRLCCLCTAPRRSKSVVAADDESCFTFDVDGLSDEALDRHALSRSLCVLSGCEYHRRADGSGHTGEYATSDNPI